MSENEFTHLSADGSIAMVDVGSKAATTREAVASARVRVSPETLELLDRKALPKGDVLTTAKVAGILAAKQTPFLIPLTHPLLLTYVDLQFEIDSNEPSVIIRATVRCHGATGVEIEAMTACSVAALTIYDMVKSVEKGAVIDRVQLDSKSGGKSGEFSRG